jgi:hypothetical protein
MEVAKIIERERNKIVFGISELRMVGVENEK